MHQIGSNIRIFDKYPFFVQVDYAAFTSMYLPNLELLLFLVVLALPNASMIGFVAKKVSHQKGLDHMLSAVQLKWTYP